MKYVVELPVRWSPADEQIAFRRVQTFARLENEVLAYYLAHANAYKRDPDYRALQAETREAILDGRILSKKKPTKKALRHVPEGVTPRRFAFANQKERNAAWKSLRERHGLFGKVGKESHTPEGLAQYEKSKIFGTSLTAKASRLGSIGLDAATINPGIMQKQCERVIEWLHIKPTKKHGGRPRFNSRREPKTTVMFCSGKGGNGNRSGLHVDFVDGTATWKAAHGKYPIVARLRWPKNDPYIRKAVIGTVVQVKMLYREIKGKRRWYVQATMDGLPPLRPSLRAATTCRPTGTVGVDVGSRHVAISGPEAAMIADFAPTMMARERNRDADIADKRDGDRVKKDRWARRLQRRISRQRERHPDNKGARKVVYRTLKKTRDGKANGKTVAIDAGFKKGVKIIASRHVRKAQAILADVARADAAARKNDHGRLTNMLALFGDTVVLEHLSYAAWQKSFGRQVKRYAPGFFEAHVRQRAMLLGMTVRGVDTRARLSQVCHACGTFEKIAIRGPIATRMKPACTCGREAVQRDLYSAFLARFACEDSSVDLQAAKAAWTGAFGLLRSAQQMYERAHEASSLAEGGANRETAGASTPDVLLSPAIATLGGYQAGVLECPPPTSVRDAGVRESGGGWPFERVNESIAPQDRSNAVVRAHLPPLEVREHRQRDG